MSLTRAMVRKTLKSKTGSISRLAKRLGVTPTTVSMVLRGRGTSSRIMVEATAEARQILQREAN